MRDQRLTLQGELRDVRLVAILMQLTSIELVSPDMNVGFQAIACPAVWAHRLAFINDVQEDSGVRCPQRHRRVRAISRQIARGEFDHRRDSPRCTHSAPRVLICVPRVALRT